MNEGGVVLGFTPFETHSNCDGGAWCTPQNFNGLILQANTPYFLAFQNGFGAGDMSGPSVYPDANARTVGIATFSDPRLDKPNQDVRGLPETEATWQNRWQIICYE